MPRNKRHRVTAINTKTTYPRLTFDQALDYVMSGKRAEGVRERTLRDYRKMFGYLTKWLAENYDFTYIDEITTEVIRNYINYMKYDKRKYSGHKYIDSSKQGIGLCDTTININLRCLRSLFNYLANEGMLEVNPMEKIKLLRQDVDLTNCFTDDEVKALLQQPNLRDFVGFRDYVAMNLLLDSGLRINELLSLRAGDVDFTTRFITLTGEVNKNRKPRLVPISSHVAKLILQLISENREHFKTDRIFLSSFGEPIGPNHFNKRLKYYAEKAGITGKKVTAHVYRHTWAKNMTLNGCDAFTLQKMGGWADIRTMRRYIQMDVEQLRESHDRVSPLNRYKNIKK